MRQWKEIQEVSRRCGLVLAAFLAVSGVARSEDQALWKEYGLLHSETSSAQNLKVTAYEMSDPTGALAAWEWRRSPNGHACDLAPFCNQDGKSTLLSDFNYVVSIEGGKPTKAQVTAIMDGLQRKKDSSLPPILTFIPEQGLVPNSARYILGRSSLEAFVPELASARLGLENGAEAQVADYRLKREGKPVRLVIINYPTPEMARLHAAELKKLPGLNVKRSGVLVALTLPPATSAESDTLLSRVQYEAKVTWNETPPPSPIKPLYQLLLNIIYLSIFLTVLCLAAGLVYAGMRVYRRRYGTLEADEAMTTLHLGPKPGR
jgi:hypothetical protein